jgi:hypothetical protein
LPDVLSRLLQGLARWLSGSRGALFEQLFSWTFLTFSQFLTAQP